MKYPCNLIRDILPLYHDYVASEESIKAVNEHLNECEGCRKYYDKMCSSDAIESLVYDEAMEIRTADSYKKVCKKIIKKVCKLACVIILAIVIFIIAIWTILVGYVEYHAVSSKKVYRDISEYNQHRSGENALANFRVRGMDEIWPEEVTGNMDVQDYLMMYYNPWDSNYLGYLTVKYDGADYEAEVERLAEYPSTDYIGNYGATGFEYYEVLAMNAGYDGFVYAITDGESTIIYVEMVFPGYGMDIEYDKYIPEEYLPEGLDATEDNPIRQKVIEDNKAGH